ncbi:MAG: hypothetical protein ACFHWZ_16130 [Phycisphaerales bacterium]
MISRPVLLNHLLQALMRSSIVVYSAQGISRRRSSSFGACSESASVTGRSSSSASREMA